MSEKAENRTVTVCDKCLTAACWQGIFMCQSSQEAGTVEKTIGELKALGLESPDYWQPAPMTSDPTNPERETKTPELKPCPFCGKPAEHDAQHWNGRSVTDRVNTGHAIYCSDQHCAGCPSFSWVFDTFDDAKDHWNTRAELDSARAEAEQLRERCARLEQAVHTLVEKRTDQYGFYYVTKHMGGLGDELSKTIDAVLNQPKP